MPMIVWILLGVAWAFAAAVIGAIIVLTLYRVFLRRRMV